MGGRSPGPICSARLGDDWIDLGTTCRTRTGAPGTVSLADFSLAATASFLNLNRDKVKFDQDHVYSKAAVAARKRDIDLQIIGDDYRKSADISIKSPAYLKELIRLGSNSAITVATNATKIQFFIIRGGGEGFLESRLSGVDADNFVWSATPTAPKPSDSVYDMNDLLAVFSSNGDLIGAALLQRPQFIDGSISKDTANGVYNVWDNKRVGIYRNTNFDVPYLGLVVDDGKKGHQKGDAWIDIHKQEKTLGCMFIVDPATPAVNTKALNTFEPKLIIDVLASIHKTPHDVTHATIDLGIMHFVDI